MKLVLFCCIVLVLQKGLEKLVSANSDNNVCTIRNREKERGCVCVYLSVMTCSQQLFCLLILSKKSLRFLSLFQSLVADRTDIRLSASFRPSQAAGALYALHLQQHNDRRSVYHYNMTLVHMPVINVKQLHFTMKHISSHSH